ncbi:hypothetical protein [Microtetraspora sp. NBRC 13810]|nr:hypothetical protein [Microtetraspora sp. NBRC 13810]
MDDPGTRDEARHHPPHPAHYDRFGLLAPSRIGANGYRDYTSNG